MLATKQIRKRMVSDRVTSLPGLDTLEGAQFAGYASVRGATGKNGAVRADEKLFYWFVGNDDYAKRPTVLWTNGGPGSSSFWGFFLENGPYEIQSAVGDYPVVKPRATAWNQQANYLIFEHPLSVTLSFPADDRDIPTSVETGIAQLYQALVSFLGKHPEIARNPLILAGESYAGTYLPLLSQAILHGNAKGTAKIDLRATVLLDSWVDPFTQMAANTTYALSHGLISQAQKDDLDKEYVGDKLADVNSEIGKICGCYMANLAEAGDPPFDPVLLYLNREDVRTAIHVPSGVPLTDSWSRPISNNYQARVNESYLPNVQALLDSGKLKILVISGLNDAKDCNFLGTGAWLNKLTGPVAKKFQSTVPLRQIDPSGNVYAFDQDAGRLAWLKVLNAGHLAVYDQPLLLGYILEKALPKRKKA
ncbi:MAG TPA: hypothetical protein VKK31_04465 [Thermoanaerobaculia bacterium]|nr:hypothetical protein [Thermoanaerobaculia bacterium]